MAKTLIQLLGRRRRGNDRAGTLLIVPHERTNSLLIQATIEDLDKIQNILKLIDVSATGEAPAGEEKFK